MEIIEYIHEEDRINEYMDFLEKHYSDDSRTQLYIGQVKKMLDNKNPFFKHARIKNFIIKEKSNFLAHASAIIDSRNKGIGLIGFYDCIEDEKISKIILDKCIDWLKNNGCSKIRGPVNLTIWHNYRFISKHKRKPDIFDPFNKDYYIEFWKNNNFVNVGRYVSAVRQDFNYILLPTKKDYDELFKKGYNLRNINKKDIESEMRIILDLANKIFLDSWNFIPLSYEEFNYLYEDILHTMDLSYIQIAEDEDSRPIGFCFSLVNPYKEDQIILKTIGVLHEIRRQNIAGALLYSQHIKAEGFKEFYYPLIRTGNSVTKFPYGGYDIITEYLVFELN